MDEDYTLYQNQEDSCYKLEFQIDMTLLNILRGFQQKNHEFTEGFLESVYALLFYYQGKPETELFSQFLLKQGGLQVEAIIFAIHFYFASWITLSPLLKVFGLDEAAIIPLVKSDVNKTNILNVHAITDRLGKVNHSLLVQKSSEIKPDYIPKLRVLIDTASESRVLKDTNTLVLNYSKIAVSIMAKGKLDPFTCSHIANLLNKAYNIELCHILLSFHSQKQAITNNYDNQFQVIAKGVREFNFDKKKYHQYREKLLHFSNSQDQNQNQFDDVTKFLNQIDSEVIKSVIARDQKANDYIEKLLIGMLGHPMQHLRDQSVVLLNILYDGVDWQRRYPYNPRISKVNSKFLIEEVFETGEDISPQSIVIMLKSFIFDNQCKQNVVSWHRPKLVEQKLKEGEKRSFIVTLNFGNFKRCGIYDWKLVRLGQSGKLHSLDKLHNAEKFDSMGNLHVLGNIQEKKPVQGRFIVHPQYSRDLQIHEIYIDLLVKKYLFYNIQDAKPDKQGKFTKRGNFSRVKDKLYELKQNGINCLYLMGALERDNGCVIDSFTEMKSYKRPEVSPLAITSRQTANTMLGGKQGFVELIERSQQLNMKIIVDCLTRISSARPHQKYREHFVYRLDENGKMVPLFGTDGRSLQFEDTIVLNYRKKEVWDLFLQELETLKEDYQVNGIHLDNCQAWPQIFALDIEEMYRLDTDGKPAFTQKQIFEGYVVQANEDCGYWGSSVKDSYPNPFLIKLCKRMWEKYPDFLILGEAWGAMGGFEEREINIITSGVIPRLFKLPIAIASVFGEDLKKDGTLTAIGKKDVNSVKKLFEQTRIQYPRGSIIVQSTTYHAWPYPALIYKRGTWAVADLFFTLSDIPMTFMGEQEGHAFREKSTQIFSYISQVPEVQPQQQVQQQTKARKMKKLDSFIMTKQQADEFEFGFGYNTFSAAQQPFKAESPQKQISSSTSSSNMQKIEAGSSISQMELWRIEGAQENFRQEVGPEYGFDLQKIGKHYEHRRKVRNDHRVLRRGKMIPLIAQHVHGWHTHVLAFARYTKKEIALVTINFNDGRVDLFITLKDLAIFFPNYEESDVVVKLRDWICPESEQFSEEISYYYIGEFLNERLEMNLNSFQSHIWGVEIYPNNPQKQKLAQISSLKRLQKKIHSTHQETLWSNDIANRIISLVTKSQNLLVFTNGYMHFYNTVMKPHGLDLNKLLSIMKQFQDDKQLLLNLFAYFNSTLALKQKYPEIEEKLPFYQSLKEVLDSNKLGPLCFLCPELGKWTTTGGLGIMVDDLTVELAHMKEDVIVISPYYERNKRGETGYLEKDGMKHIRNIDIWVDGVKYVFGVHYGVFNMVKLYWLHNPELFPTAYCGDDPKYIMKQLAAYGKASLETLCQLGIIPSIVVTNDWFCGLVPGYLKLKYFGETFSGTKSFHIVHNLDPLYEGRLYPTPQDGNLQNIHDLPNDLFIDPAWDSRIVNPSRAALLMCDNWGTVSQSYRMELLRDSPLAPVLRRHPNPFAHPNGIRREQRIKLIQEKTHNDHNYAKEILQKKYFNCKTLQEHIPMFGFVGRVTRQKGVHLILDIAEDLIRNHNGQIHILVAGPAEMKEAYSAECAYRMTRLRHIYPNNFWADPSLFFTDGTLVNVGCDFCLMPSEFEPGGIVQHEFFIGGTPVIAYKTGGLRDTVIEYNTQTQKGSGFTFEQYTRGDFLYAIERALTIFRDEKQYQKLRKNSFDAAIDVAQVARAWVQEFYRLFKKNYIDKDIIEQQLMKMDLTFDPEQVKEDCSLFMKKEGKVLGRNMEYSIQ